MSTTEPEIENVLRTAPKPPPPAGLRQRLIAQLRLPQVRPAASLGAGPAGLASWLRRWWPVLLPAAVSVACAVGLTMQGIQIRDLKQAIAEMPKPHAATLRAISVPPVKPADTPAQADAAARTQQEIARLKALAAQLAAEITELERLHAENVKLRAELAAPPPGMFTPEETEAANQARENAECTACVNNLKQFGLAVRLWALDNNDISAPDIISMSNELNTTRILICPSDKTREAAKDWNSFNLSHCSYEYLAPSAPDTEPTRVMARCPIHGNVCLCDGSVQREVTKRHPEMLIQRNGKLYFSEPAEPSPTAAEPQSASSPPGGSSP